MTGLPPKQSRGRVRTVRSVPMGAPTDRPTTDGHRAADAALLGDPAAGLAARRRRQGTIAVAAVSALVLLGGAWAFRSVTGSDSSLPVFEASNAHLSMRTDTTVPGATSGATTPTSVVAPVDADDHEDDRHGDWFSIADGKARIVFVSDRNPMHTTKGQGAMANMSSMIPDPVPAGKRRVTVELTVAATEGSTITLPLRPIRLGDFEPYREQWGTDAIPSGMKSTGVVVFEIPEETRRITLEIGGRKTTQIVLGKAHIDRSAHDGAAPEATEAPSGATAP
jgi:hypothetical protein